MPLERTKRQKLNEELVEYMKVNDHEHMRRVVYRKYKTRLFTDLETFELEEFLSEFKKLSNTCHPTDS